MKLSRKLGPLEALLLGSCILAIAVLFLYIFTLGNLSFHSDSASMITLAHEQLGQRTLFPNGWCASTNLHEITLFQLLPQALLKNDWLLASDFAQAAITLVMLATLVFFGKSVFKNRAWVLFLLLLTSYVSGCQYDMLYLQCAFTGEVIMAFGFFAVYIRFTEADCKKSKVIWGTFCAGLLFFFSLFGIVTPETVTIPLIGSLLLRYLYQSADKKPADVFQQKKLWGTILALCVISVLGVLINVRILEPLANLHMEHNALTRFTSIEKLFEGIEKIVVGFFYYIGSAESTGSSFFSVDGILSFIRLGLMLPMTLFFPFMEIKRWKELSREKQLFVFYVIVYCAETLLILLFGNEGIWDYPAAARYELVMIVLLNALGCDYVYEKYIKEERLISWLYSLIACCFLVLSLFSLRGLPTYTARMQNLRGLTDYLQENDLHYGYASFWNAGKNTVLSNGNVQINSTFLRDGLVTPYLWLSSENWYEPDNWQGETFLLLTEEEWQQFTARGQKLPVYGIPQRELQYDGYHILAYNYNIAENSFSGKLGKLDGTENYLAYMSCSSEEMRQADGSIQLNPGDVLYGPYISLDPGSYRLTADLTEATVLTITSDCGATVIGTYELTPENGHLVFTLPENSQNVEFVIHGEEQPLTVTDIRIEKE